MEAPIFFLCVLAGVVLGRRVYTALVRVGVFNP
jgi:hypothetical protein